MFKTFDSRTFPRYEIFTSYGTERYDECYHQTVLVCTYSIFTYLLGPTFWKYKSGSFFNVSLYVWLYQLIRMYKSTTFFIYSNTLECIFLLCPMVCAVLNASIILNIPYSFFKDGLLVDICCMSHKFNFSILFLKTVHLFLRHIFT